MTQVIIIGGGWRAEFYLRIAEAMPKRFRVSAICVRNPQRATELSAKYGVKVVSAISDALKEPFDFVVNCINKEDISDLTVELADKGYYVLSETPIIKRPEMGHNYEKIQVAEQFHLKGTYQALWKLLNEGFLGKIQYLNISVAHEYHAMSLIRFLLRKDDAPKHIFCETFSDSVYHTHWREGALSDVREVETGQQIKIFDYSGTLVLYDYNPEQYFSPIRKDRILIRGTRGEVENNKVRYLNDANQQVSGEIIQSHAGLLDGGFLDKITFENRVLFRYSYPEARLSEEELAMVQCLENMKRYIETGESFYSYEKAYQDWEYFHK